MNENLRKMIVGEKMPDKNDPRYREKYEKDVEAGRKFARRTGLDRLAGYVQRFADRHSGLFLGIVLAIVIGCFVVNAYHFTKAWRLRKEHIESTALPGERIEEMVEEAHTKELIRDNGYGTDTED